MFIKESRIAQKIAMMNKSGYPDSTNNCLAHPEETLDNENLQATTNSDHDGRGQYKAQADLMCSVSQTERVLSMNEIGYEFHISLNFHSNLAE